MFASHLSSLICLFLLLLFPHHKNYVKWTNEYSKLLASWSWLLGNCSLKRTADFLCPVSVVLVCERILSMFVVLFGELCDYPPIVVWGVIILLLLSGV